MSESLKEELSNGSDADKQDDEKNVKVETKTNGINNGLEIEIKDQKELKDSQNIKEESDEDDEESKSHISKKIKTESDDADSAIKQ